MSETETAKLIERLRTREVPGVVTYGAGTGSTVATCFAAPDPDCIAAADALTASLSREAALVKIAERALQTIENAHREGFSAGMDECIKFNGGKPWSESNSAMTRSVLLAELHRAKPATAA